MSLLSRHRSVILVAALAMLALRALTPLGYMPASPGSGLVFELCPEGLPAALVQALADPGHHHHHGAGDAESPVTSAEQCPIGHMLSTSAAGDGAVAAPVAPDAPEFLVTVFLPLFWTRRTTFRCRAPPC